MTALDRARWLSLEPLLDRALELSAAEQEDWLATLDTTAPEDARDLRHLLSLARVAEAEHFLAPESAHPSLAGHRIGAYTLERPLGHGGMGSVWLARRTDGRFEGQAAVKLLNVALMSGRGEERFRREGSVLARLTHPGIARLLDAGISAGGPPYLVLEYVDGVPIDQYATQRRLSTEGKVRLMLQVLDAVAHAHANLVVHRDLKPSNVLVSDDGTVKLLDFGIAMLLDDTSGRGDGAAVVTGGSARLMTLAFAAPEQIEGQAITTATDVYAAGAMLYLLLTGRHPTGGAMRTPVEAMRAVLEVEPAPVGGGELDLILAKALRKAPGERYPSAASFADDLRRWLVREPITARAPTLGYRVRKFAQRNPTGLAVAALFLAISAAYVASVVRDRARVRAALAEATLGTRKAEELTEFAVSLFDERDAAQSAGERDMRSLLARGVQRARELTGEPVARAQMLDVMGRIHLGRGEYAQARPVLEEALTIRRALHGNAHPDVATSLMNIGRALHLSGASADAVPLLEESLAIRTRAFGRDDARTMDALYYLASAAHGAGDFDTSRPLFDQWVAYSERRDVAPTPERAERLVNAAVVLRRQMRFDDAARLVRAATAIDSTLYGPGHPRVAFDLSSLASIIENTRDYAAAEALHRRAVAIHRADTISSGQGLANATRNLASNLHLQRRFAEAESTWREVAGSYASLYGEESIPVLNARGFLGYVVAQQGRFADAAAILAPLLASPLARERSSALVTDRNRVFMADALRGLGRLEEAHTLMRSTWPAIERRRAIALWDYRTTAEFTARIHEARGRADSAAHYRALAQEARIPR